MTGTPSRSTTSVLLPSWRRTWLQARTEPTASPSGRACEVSTKRWRCSMCFRTSASMHYPSYGKAAPHARFRLASLLQAGKKLVNSSPELLGPVQFKNQFGGVAQAEPFGDLVADEALGR